MSEAVTITVTPPDLALPTGTATVLCEAITGWQIIDERGKVLTLSDLTVLIGDDHDLQNPLRVAIALEEAGFCIRWQSSVADKVLERKNKTSCRTVYCWPKDPTVLALVPHWRCDHWLHRCLTSLIQQTHPLTHIVVIDDGSVSPPLEIVQEFPNVTLLAAPERVGPYRLIQSAIEMTDYTAYLFQDADDWSSCDRLETLLKTARTNSAELVGSQEIRVIEPALRLQSVGYPLDTNEALRRSPGHALLHPTSLVTRSLVQRLGGFATGLMFGGDTEFLLRAHWIARVVNSSRYGYFRRKRPDSLTTAVATGLGSVAREALTCEMKRVEGDRRRAFLQQQPLNLKPLKLAPPIALTHLWGPSLLWSK